MACSLLFNCYNINEVITMKFIKKAQILSYIIFSLSIIIIGMLFYRHSLYINNNFNSLLMYDFSYLYFPYLIIVVVVFISILFFLKNKRNSKIKQYLDESVLPHIDLNHDSKTKALYLFKKYALLRIVFSYLLQLILFTIIFYYFDKVFILQFDYSSLTWYSLFSMNDYIIFIASLVIILIIEIIAIILFYLKKLNYLFYDDTPCYLYLSYLFLSLKRSRINSVNKTHLFNIGTAIGNLGYYQYALSYMENLCDVSPSIKKNKNLNFMYYFNCYIYQKRLNQDSEEYKNIILEKLNSKKIQKSKVGQFVIARLKIEELFDLKNFDELIDYIEINKEKLLQAYDQPYIQCILYICYKKTEDPKYIEIQDKFQNNQTFQKLLKMFL